ncbi:MAG TPA: hypothetical protein VMQ93_19400, partial [Novosphingobium sp.]|nr:hypothetical protein [Novosphingobium sp.]
LLLADMRFQKVGDQVRTYMAQDKELGALDTQVWNKKNVVKDLLDAYNQGLSRRQEDQADALGLDLVIKGKYSDGGFGNALTFLQQQEVRDGDVFQQFGNEFSGYLKSASGKALAEFSQGGDVNSIWRGLADGLWRNAQSVAYKKVKGMVTATHRPAKKRLAGLGKYMDNAYSSLEPVDGGDTWLTGVRATAEYKEAEATVRAITLARETIPADACAPADNACPDAVMAGAAKALLEVRPAQATRYRSTPLVVNTVAFLTRVSGNYASADQLYDVADRAGVPAAPAAPSAAKGKGKGKGKVPAKVVAPPPPPVSQPVQAGAIYMQQSLDGFAEHVELLLRMKNHAKAKTVIALARSRYGDDERFLPAMITIAVQARDVPGLTSALTRCQMSEDKALVQACEIAFLNPEQREAFDQLAPADQDKITLALSKVSSDARKSGSCGLPTAAEVKAAEDAAKDDT